MEEMPGCGEVSAEDAEGTRTVALLDLAVLLADMIFVDPAA